MGKLTQRYNRLQIALHWLMALMIIGGLAMGLLLDDMPLSPLKLKMLRRPSGGTLRLIRPFSASRSSTPVSVPLVISVFSPSSLQLIPAVFPSVAMMSNCGGVRPSSRICRLDVSSKLW